jgi:hypothetical protein
MHRVISSIRKNDPAKLPSIADTWFVSALAERNSNDAETALVALGDGTFGTNSVQLSRSFGQGLLARMIKDDARAHAAFTAARLEQEKVVKAQAPIMGLPGASSDSSTLDWEEKRRHCVKADALSSCCPWKRMRSAART